MNSHKKTQKGFTILVAVITAGILLIIAMSIGGIALKEQVLSTANKESQIAFYAADTGMECALYWDQKKGAFAPGIDAATGNAIKPTVLPSINCNNGNVSQMTDSGGDITHYSYTFLVSKLPIANSTSGSCAVVEITKDISNTSKTYTTIQSYGYDTCDPTLNRLERGITTTY